MSSQATSLNDFFPAFRPFDHDGLMGEIASFFDVLTLSKLSNIQGEKGAAFKALHEKEQARIAHNKQNGIYARRVLTEGTEKGITLNSVKPFKDGNGFLVWVMVENSNNASFEDELWSFDAEYQLLSRDPANSYPPPRCIWRAMGALGKSLDVSKECATLDGRTVVSIDSQLVVFDYSAHQKEIDDVPAYKVCITQENPDTVLLQATEDGRVIDLCSQKNVRKPIRQGK